jgi:hypothetical protein
VDATGAACPGVVLPKFTAADVKGAVFAESNPTGTTVGSTYGKCSMGKTKLTVANSKVADLVKLPCDGTTNEVAWTFSKCDFDDFNGYADAADLVLEARGINMTKYQHRCVVACCLARRCLASNPGWLRSAPAAAGSARSCWEVTAMLFSCPVFRTAEASAFLLTAIAALCPPILQGVPRPARRLPLCRPWLRRL